MREAARIDIVDYDFHEGDGFGDKMEAAFRGDIPVLIGGGDGTIAHAAGIALRENKPFGILPMGTMNMLAQDLGIPSVLEAENIFDLYADTHVEAIDVGMVNGKPFLCCAALGTIPEASQYREQFRHLPDILMIPRLTAFIMDQMSVAHMRDLRVATDGHETIMRTASLVVSNNRFASSSDADHKLAKQSLHGGTLGLYSAAPKTMFERIRLLMHLQQGALEADAALTEHDADRIVVTTDKAKELVSIDGEPVEMNSPLTFEMKHDALQIIVPASSHG